MNVEKLTEQARIQYSIIVPVYNIEKLIEKCIRSLLCQQGNNYEIILVDDGSTDNSGRICDNLKSESACIKVIHKKNGGLVSARKAGAKIAIGEFVICVDGDDWVSNRMLTSFNRIIDKYNPDIIMCNYSQVFPDFSREHKMKLNGGFYDQSAIKESIYPILLSDRDGIVFEPTVWAKAIKRELYLKNQLLVNDQIKIGEDGACTIPCFINAGSVYVIDENLYYYRYNQNSMTKEKKPFSWEGIIAIYNHIVKNVDLSADNFTNQFNRRMIHSIFNVAYSQFYSKESYWKTRINIRQNIHRDIFRKIINSDIDNISFKLRMARFVLKNDLFIVLKLYSILH